jgi:hypothetical protein
MFNTDLDALIPMLCITLTALATMGTEAFRDRSERLPIDNDLSSPFEGQGAISSSRSSKRASRQRPSSSCPL